MTRLVLFLFLIALNFNSLAQEGGPPMITDDARVADYKEWELNPSINCTVTNRVFLSLPHIDLNYGIYPNFQLKIEAPMVFNFKNKEFKSTELGEVNFGIKFRFLDEKKYFVSVATFPQYVFTGEKGLFLPLFFEKTIGKFLGGVATAYFLGQNDRNRFEMGLLSGFRATEKFHLMMEYYSIENLYKPDNRNDYFNIGFRKEITENVLIMGSFGTQILSKDFQTREKLISWVGLRTLF